MSGCCSKGGPCGSSARYASRHCSLCVCCSRLDPDQEAHGLSLLRIFRCYRPPSQAGDHTQNLTIDWVCWLTLEYYSPQRVLSPLDVPCLHLIPRMYVLSFELACEAQASTGHNLMQEMHVIASREQTEAQLSRMQTMLLGLLNVQGKELCNPSGHQ